MPVKMSNFVSEPRCTPPRPIVPDFTISAKEACALAEANIREKVFKLIREAAKAGKYKEFISYNSPSSLIEELKNLGYKIDSKKDIGLYKIDWSKDDGAS